MLVSFWTLHYMVYLEVLAVPFFPLLFSSTFSSALSLQGQFNCFTWTPLPLVQCCGAAACTWAALDHWSVVVRLLRGPVLDGKNECWVSSWLFLHVSELLGRATAVSEMNGAVACRYFARLPSWSWITWLLASSACLDAPRP